MKSFFQEYGLTLFQTIVIVILIMMVSPLSTPIKTAMNDSIVSFQEVVLGDNVNNNGFMGSADEAMDKALNINQKPNHTEDGDINSGNDTDGKDTGDIGDIGLH